MLGIFDIQTFSLIERTNFEGLSLVSSALTSMATGDVSSIDSGDEVAHSVRVYKGKIFLLVSVVLAIYGILRKIDFV